MPTSFGLVGKPTHRADEAEIKVTLVWLAQQMGRCGWTEFNHIGTANGSICPGLDGGGGYENYV